MAGRLNNLSLVNLVLVNLVLPVAKTGVYNSLHTTRAVRFGSAPSTAPIMASRKNSNRIRDLSSKNPSLSQSESCVNRRPLGTAIAYSFLWAISMGGKGEMLRYHDLSVTGLCAVSGAGATNWPLNRAQT
jgi:hypothetical protein